MTGVITAIRVALRRSLPPPASFAVRANWRFLSSLPPRMIVAPFVTRRLQIYGYGGGDGASSLVAQLRSVNALAPTHMRRVMTKFGSDTDSPRFHNYTTVYSTLFDGWRDRPLRIFELGLGTNDWSFASTMGVGGVPGASLRGWRALLPQALVYGADIDRGTLFEEERIKTCYCDQLDAESIRALWSRPELRDGMDILIEGGLHTFAANVSFLEGSLEKLRPGGVSVVENIVREEIPRWLDRLETIDSKRWPDYEFALILLPGSPNERDNNLLVVRRPR
jgi:hypothetical protein